MPPVPARILTVEDCKLRIEKCMEKMETPNMLEDDLVYQEALIAIWSRAEELIEGGTLLTLDMEERFEVWGTVN